MRTILVTGSASGLGKAIHDQLLSAGHNVYGFDLPENDVLKPDISKLKGVEFCDTLVNCAGINHLDWLSDYTEEDYDKVMGVNAKGIFLMVKALLPSLIKNKGSVLNIISDASHRPMRCSIAYNASKAAAHMLTLQMARELSNQYGITVFGISPAQVNGTGMSLKIEEEVHRVRGWTATETRNAALSNSVTGQVIDIETFAQFVAYLLFSKSRHHPFSGCVIPYGA